MPDGIDSSHSRGLAFGHRSSKLPDCFRGPEHCSWFHSLQSCHWDISLSFNTQPSDSTLVHSFWAANIRPKIPHNTSPNLDDPPFSPSFCVGNQSFHLGMRGSNVDKQPLRSLSLPTFMAILSLPASRENQNRHEWTHGLYCNATSIRLEAPSASCQALRSVKTQCFTLTFADSLHWPHNHNRATLHRGGCDDRIVQTSD